MLYLIDSANHDQIMEVLAYGAYGITANTSMYRKEGISIIDYVKTYQNANIHFLSAEVIGSYEEMLSQSKQILSLNSDIVIKINMSKDGLRLAKTLHDQGHKTAMTLVFTIAQTIAAINSGVDYLFFFLGRNEEIGNDALSAINHVQQIIKEKGYTTKVVAASIKSLYQLEKLAQLHIDYAAIPYDLYMNSLHHPLTISGAKTFEIDYYENKAITDEN